MASSKEQTAKYRQKMAQDKIDTVKKKDRERKKLERSQMNSARIAHERAEAKQRMWKLRHKRKRKYINNTRNNEDTTRDRAQIIVSPYGSRQAQGKAVKQVQVNLPKSPRNRNM